VSSDAETHEAPVLPAEPCRRRGGVPGRGRPAWPGSGQPAAASRWSWCEGRALGRAGHVAGVAFRSSQAAVRVLGRGCGTAPGATSRSTGRHQSTETARTGSELTRHAGRFVGIPAGSASRIRASTQKAPSGVTMTGLRSISASSGTSSASQATPSASSTPPVTTGSSRTGTSDEPRVRSNDSAASRTCEAFSSPTATRCAGSRWPASTRGSPARARPAAPRHRSWCPDGHRHRSRLAGPSSSTSPGACPAGPPRA